MVYSTTLNPKNTLKCSFFREPVAEKTLYKLDSAYVNVVINSMENYETAKKQVFRKDRKNVCIYEISKILSAKIDSLDISFEICLEMARIDGPENKLYYFPKIVKIYYEETPLFDEPIIVIEIEFFTGLDFK